MTEQECLDKMVAPGTPREGKYRRGVIQIWTTNACDKSCFGCTQLGNIRGKPRFITVDQFRQACRSLRGYFGVVGMFGANCALHPEFLALCDVMRQEVPADQRGLWSNHPIKPVNAQAMRHTFDPSISNLNVHLDREAFAMFKEHWPECNPVGLTQDSRHSPPFVAMKDVLDDEAKRWELISRCDINQHWSAMIGVFRGELRAYFCEVAGAQAMLHQDEPDYPDTGIDPTVGRSGYDGWHGPKESSAWWELPMQAFAGQVRKHCHECSVPLRGYGELAMADDSTGLRPEGMGWAKEQTSATHAAVYKPKRRGRRVEVVTSLEQLGIGRLDKMTKYLQNASK